MALRRWLRRGSGIDVTANTQRHECDEQGARTAPKHDDGRMKAGGTPDEAVAGAGTVRLKVVERKRPCRRKIQRAISRDAVELMVHKIRC